MQKALKVIPNKVDKSILLTLDKPYFSLIWLHGLGDSSAGFLDFFQHPMSPAFKGARVQLLHAPIRPVTINGGATMPSWYDICELSAGGNEKQKYDFEQINQSISTIDKYVTEEVNYWKQNGVKDSEEAILKRIFVGGFSQGCAMSLAYALTGPRLVGGVVGFSGHLFESLDLKNKGTLFST
jgi:phospholipase/carboxylesterase